MAYIHHTVALFGKKASQERLPSRISALLDITLNDDDGLPNFRCAECKQRVERLEAAMMDKVRSVAVLLSELSLRHYIIPTSIL